MSFVLQGEVNIDGRKGIVTLKSIQREATKTSQSFDRAGSSTSKLVASFLKANSAASVFGTSLRALGRFGGAGILGAGTATALNRFGEAVKKNATEYFQAQKSLADAFEVSFKSKNVSEAQAGLERTKDIADELRGKLTQLGALGNLLGGLERLTGLKIFGVEDTKKALEQARQQIQAQEEIVAARKKEKEQIDIIEKTAREENAKRDIAIETLKTNDAISEKKKTIFEQARLEAEKVAELLQENEKILEILEKTEAGQKDLEQIEKRKIERIQLQLQYTKALNQQELAQIQIRRQLGGILSGSKAGQQALSVAQRQKERADRKQAFREEEEAVKQRQAEENASRAAQGLPMLNQADIRKRMAAEAVGGEARRSAQGVNAMAMNFSRNLLGDRGATMAATRAREKAAPSDFGQRVKQFKAREAQKAMQEEATGMRKMPIDLGAVQKASAARQIEGTKSVVGLLQIIARKLPSPPIPV